jgi:predicted component of type VI protein secretion system
VLRISVLSLHGVVPAQPQFAEFGPEGGSIGREEGNTLVLEDPGKHLSRVQASIKWLGGEYFLVDQGGNPSRVNGRELGKGKVVSLHAGDRIAMADWELLAELLPRTSHLPPPLEVSPVPVPVQAALPPQATVIGREQEFDFQLSTRVTGGPVDPRSLLEAFMRGVGLQAVLLPSSLDAAQAERLGVQLRSLLGEPAAIAADTLHTLLGAALERSSDEAVPSAQAGRPS